MTAKGADADEVVVIGAGLVGAATARYLAEAGRATVVVGPAEPEDLQQAHVFGSHYDQGRVQRLIGFDSLWTRLNVRSAQVWPDLERRTGIHLHDRVGCLYLAPHRDDHLAAAADLARLFDLTYDVVTDPRVVRDIAPQLDVPDSVVGLFERAPAGSINPRAVIAAQLVLAKSAGATVVRDVATAVRREGGLFEVPTASGAVYSAGTVVVATGSFTNASGLLPGELDVQVKGETVVLAEVSPDTAAELSELPSLLYEVETDDFDGIYAIKPLRYPDGRFYLKLGMNQRSDPRLDEPELLQQWFRDPAADDTLPRLRGQVSTLFPQVPFLSFHTRRCVISRTVGRRPYLGTMDQGLVVAMGCNGYSAMASDEQGRIAANLVQTGQVPEEYDARELAVRTK